MRDTTFLRSSKIQAEEDRRVATYWENLNEWPWASEGVVRLALGFGSGRLG